MPKGSKETASSHEQVPGLFESFIQEVDGWTVTFEADSIDGDAAFLFKGVPNDQCQETHMGYVDPVGRALISVAEARRLVLAAIAPAAPASADLSQQPIKRRAILGGLIQEYQRGKSPGQGQ